MATDAEVKIQISQDIIKAHVQAAVASVLAKDPEALVKAVVDAAMNEKTNSYDRTTIWEKKVNELIRKVADGVFEAWLNEQKPAIEKAVRTQLSKKSTCQDIAASIVQKMCRVHVDIALTDGK